MAKEDGRATAAEVRAGYAAAVGLVRELEHSMTTLELTVEEVARLVPTEAWGEQDGLAADVEQIFGECFACWRGRLEEYKAAGPRAMQETALLGAGASPGVWRVGGRGCSTAFEAAGLLGYAIVRAAPVDCGIQGEGDAVPAVASWHVENMIAMFPEATAPFALEVFAEAEVSLRYHAALAERVRALLAEADAPALGAALRREEAAVLAALASEAQAAALLAATARLTAAAGAGTVGAGGEAVEVAAEGGVGAGKAKGKAGKGKEEAEAGTVAARLGVKAWGELEVRVGLKGLRVRRKGTGARLETRNWRQAKLDGAPEQRKLLWALAEGEGQTLNPGTGAHRRLVGRLNESLGEAFGLPGLAVGNGRKGLTRAAFDITLVRGLRNK